MTDAWVGRLRYNASTGWLVGVAPDASIELSLHDFRIHRVSLDFRPALAVTFGCVDADGNETLHLTFEECSFLNVSDIDARPRPDSAAGQVNGIRVSEGDVFFFDTIDGVISLQSSRQTVLRKRL